MKPRPAGEGCPPPCPRADALFRGRDVRAPPRNGPALLVNPCPQAVGLSCQDVSSQLSVQDYRGAIQGCPLTQNERLALSMTVKVSGQSSEGAFAVSVYLALSGPRNDRRMTC